MYTIFETLHPQILKNIFTSAQISSLLLNIFPPKLLFKCGKQTVVRWSQVQKIGKVGEGFPSQIVHQIDSEWGSAMTHVILLKNFSFSFPVMAFFKYSMVSKCASWYWTLFHKFCFLYRFWISTCYVISELFENANSLENLASSVVFSDNWLIGWFENNNIYNLLFDSLALTSVSWHWWTKFHYCL